jgi:hypothetical protein
MQMYYKLNITYYIFRPFGHQEVMYPYTDC